ncbi:Na/Pi cotransporter family protein [Bowmanella dokdonensis]|uniref:Na/Pi symporter n=1 Tax=Bowmanella dokdonensis TaxID=751969 RepID=A0A939DKA7_9ALTE|nr:Na/Pi symporter [Bowmanella dokdonensis]MBN7824298.1 Na/Pi symporter [Bowmanella dokdonensis]
MQILGALGLFLIGMWLMTEGLKVAGGKALEHMLGKWISSRLRGFLAGVLVTGLVQSSSAVTVATIGFINAGLMSFSQSVWVIFGSNVGTTFTAWLVTLVGFKLDMSLITLPLVGVGALLKVFSPRVRGQSLGMALAGFGLLFMGIGALQESFYAIDVQQLALGQWLNSPVFTGLFLGIILTILTQSSSAAIAIILTASASGMADLHLAAAAVIGANVGTTSTALIAGLGASASAKRLVLAHVMFNLITATVALLLLPLLGWLFDDLDGHPGEFPFYLAVFHSGFNLFGVLLMLPLEPVMSRWLLARFRKKTVRLSALDDNLAAVPDLAISALFKQIQTLRQDVLSLSLEPAQQRHALSDIRQKLSECQNFVIKSGQNTLTELQSQKLEGALAVLHGLSAALESYEEYTDFSGQFDPQQTELQDWLKQSRAFSELQLQGMENLEIPWQALNEQYARLRHRLIRSTMTQHLEINSLEQLLRAISANLRYQRRLVELSPTLREALPQGTG